MSGNDLMVEGVGQISTGCPGRLSDAPCGKP